MDRWIAVDFKNSVFFVFFLVEWDKLRYSIGRNGNYCGIFIKQGDYQIRFFEKEYFMGFFVF